MRAEHRELMDEQGIPSQRRGLSGIDGLVTVEAERVEIDHSHCESEHHDGAEPDIGRDGAPRRAE